MGVQCGVWFGKWQCGLLFGDGWVSVVGLGVCEVVLVQVWWLMFVVCGSSMFLGVCFVEYCVYWCECVVGYLFGLN